MCDILFSRAPIKHTVSKLDTSSKLYTTPMLVFLRSYVESTMEFELCGYISFSFIFPILGSYQLNLIPLEIPLVYLLIQIYGNDLIVLSKFSVLLLASFSLTGFERFSSVFAREKSDSSIWLSLFSCLTSFDIQDRIYMYATCRIEDSGTRCIRIQSVRQDVPKPFRISSRNPATRDANKSIFSSSMLRESESDRRCAHEIFPVSAYALVEPRK